MQLRSGSKEKHEGRTAGTPSNVDEYLAQVQPEAAREALARLRAIIGEELPDAEEAISYGMPAFKLGGPVVWYAAFKDHCSFFAGYTVGEFADRLEGYRISKGTIQFRPEKPIPEALVREIVKARLAACSSKGRKSTSPRR